MLLDVLKQFRPLLVRNITPLHHVYIRPQKQAFFLFPSNRQTICLWLFYQRLKQCQPQISWRKSDVSMTEYGVSYKKDCQIIFSITLKLFQKILLIWLSTKPPVSTVALAISGQLCLPLFPIFLRKQKGPFPQWITSNQLIFTPYSMVTLALVNPPQSIMAV